MEDLPVYNTMYLPPVSFLAKAGTAGTILLEANENYQKQSYRNRCRIMTANGVQNLVIPVLHGGGVKIPVTEVMTDEKQAWRRLHWRAISSAYANSPYFLYYADELKEIILNGSEYLFTFNRSLLRWLLDSLGINSGIGQTGDYLRDYCNLDLRDAFHPKKPPLDIPPYYQVFESRHGFIPDLSGIDLLFHLGPEARTYIDRL